MKTETTVPEELWQAITTDDGPTVQSLLADHPEWAGGIGKDGVSLLLSALYRRRSAALAALLASAPPLDAFEAAALGREDRLRAVLDAGGDVQARSRDGFTALQLAAYFGQPGTAAVLLERGAEVNAVASNPMRLMALHSAASAAVPEIIRMLLAHGAEVNARQEGGFTPLHAAAQNGDLESLDLLLAHGADPTLQTDDGRTASDFALAAGKPTAVERLRRRATE
jgi:ankyrin repeat protein